MQATSNTHLNQTSLLAELDDALELLLKLNTHYQRGYTTIHLKDGSVRSYQHTQDNVTIDGVSLKGYSIIYQQIEHDTINEIIFYKDDESKIHVLMLRGRNKSYFTFDDVSDLDSHLHYLKSDFIKSKLIKTFITDNPIVYPDHLANSFEYDIGRPYIQLDLNKFRGV